MSEIEAHDGTELKVVKEENEQYRFDNQRLRDENYEYMLLTGRLGYLLTLTANALKGEPPALVWHDWSDLPKVALALVERCERLERALEISTGIGPAPTVMDDPVTGRLVIHWLAGPEARFVPGLGCCVRGVGGFGQ